MARWLTLQRSIVPAGERKKFMERLKARLTKSGSGPDSDREPPADTQSESEAARSLPEYARRAAE